MSLIPHTRKKKKFKWINKIKKSEKHSIHSIELNAKLGPPNMDCYFHIRGLNSFLVVWRSELSQSITVWPTISFDFNNNRQPETKSMPFVTTLTSDSCCEIKIDLWLFLPQATDWKVPGSRPGKFHENQLGRKTWSQRRRLRGSLQRLQRDRMSNPSHPLHNSKLATQPVIFN